MLIIFSIPCKSYSFTGNDMYEWVTTTRIKDVDIMSGLFMGEVSAAIYWSDPSKICIPKGATSSQAYYIVEQFVKSKPQYRHENAQKIILRALRQAWPCR